MPLIFVYGTLKRNKKLHHYLKTASFLGECSTKNRYPLFVAKSKWYPYMLNKNDGKIIKGELYKLNFNTLKMLDRIEETPHYYVRKQIPVNYNGKTLKVWCYFAKKNHNYLKRDLIESFV
ncbi:MAG: gamma-glutamylcyclotransferase [Epsilonproteobacteria bacterium]|nr:gamma-glutamylcyclotransferase [Campylobacterota bacterium]